MKSLLPTLADLQRGLAPLDALPKLKLGLAELARVKRVFTPQNTPDAGGVLERVEQFGHNPGDLRLWRFVPPGLRPGAPLVVVLHGCTQTAPGFDRGTGWSTLARRLGFALLYPEQVRGNNHNLCFNWFEPGDVTRGSGEVGSIRSMVAATITELSIDRRRVFVTGLSAGGAMTAALLATYPDVFAAGAIVAGLPYGLASNTGEALAQMYHPAPRPPAELGAAVRRAGPDAAALPRVSIWHGDADPVVVPANAGELVKQWCDIHGLQAGDAQVDKVDGATHRAWRGRDGAILVEAFSVPGLAHGTPITPGAPGERGVGHAMPHILTSTVSSTWHIAQGWGLLG